MNAITSVPAEVLQHILFLLPVQDLFRSQQVCKAWRQAIQETPPTLWSNYYCRFYFRSSNATLEVDKNRVLKARTKYKIDERGNTKELAEQEKDDLEHKEEISKIASKDPSAPKEPPSALVRFIAERQEDMKTANPDFKSIPSVNRRLTEEWDALPRHKKRRYAEEAMEAMEQYKKQLAKYKQKKLQELRSTVKPVDPELAFWKGLTLNRAIEYYTNTVRPPTAALRQMVQVAESRFDNNSLLLSTDNELQDYLGKVKEYDDFYNQMQRISTFVPPFLKHHRASIVLLEQGVSGSTDYPYTVTYSATFVLYGATGARIKMNIQHKGIHHNNYITYSGSISVNGEVIRPYGTRDNNEADLADEKSSFKTFVNLLYGEQKGKTRVGYFETTKTLANLLRVCEKLEGFKPFRLNVGKDIVLYRMNPVPLLEAMQPERSKDDEDDDEEEDDEEDTNETKRKRERDDDDDHNVTPKSKKQRS